MNIPIPVLFRSLEVILIFLSGLSLYILWMYSEIFSPAFGWWDVVWPLLGVAVMEIFVYIFPLPKEKRR